MPDFRVIPELVKQPVTGKWVLEPFAPTAPAFNWPEFEGRIGVIYVVEAFGYHKIGLSTDFEKRFRQIDAGIPVPLKRVATRRVPLAGMAYSEAWLHKQLAARRVKGEWFSVTREEALANLSKAVVRANAFARRCRQWHQEDLVRKSGGAMGDRLEAEYQAYLARTAATAELEAALGTQGV